MSLFVYCLAHDEPRAERIVHMLVQSAFRAGDISVLIPDQARTRETTAHALLPTATAGGMRSNPPEWVPGIRHLAISGMGSFNATGPIRASAASGFIATLMDLGMPGYEAKCYERKVRQGSILLSVHPENLAPALRAKEIFVQMGGSDIGCTGQAGTSFSKAKTEPILRAVGMTRDDASCMQRHRSMGC